MTLKSTAKDAWKYLRTSHGTHDGWEGNGYGGSEPVTIPNKTPLEKIAGVGLVLIVLAVGGLGVKCCIDEDVKRQERTARYFVERQEKYVPSSIGLEMTIMSRNVNFDILKNEKDPKYVKVLEDSIRKDEAEIQQATKDIRMKLEKGYLKPGGEHYERYKKIFGNEPWWQEAERKAKVGE